MARKKSRFRSAKNYKEGLRERTDAASTLSGGKWKPIFRSDVKFPRWVCGEGEHVIDIIPFLDNDDEPQYKVELLVHQRVGPDEGNYICPRTWDSTARCPLCEVRSKVDEDTASALRPKERVVYNIMCYDSPKEEDKGVQIWEASAYLAENNFKAAAKKRQKGGRTERIYFADPDEGRTISFERVGKGMTTKYQGFIMEERDEPIPDEILDEAYNIYDLLEMPDEDILQEQADLILASTGGGSSSEDEEEEERPRRRPSRASRRPSRRKEEEPEYDDEDTGDDVPFNDEMDEPEEEPEEEEAPKRSRRRTSRTRRRRS